MIAGRQQFMKIRGRDVYKFAVQRFNEMIEDAMTKCELTVDKVKLIIPHQVNQRIIRLQPPGYRFLIQCIANDPHCSRRHMTSR